MDNFGYVPESGSNGQAFTISRGSPGTKQANTNELLVEINSRFKPSKKLLYYRRATFLLAALGIVLLLALIIALISHPKLHQSICTSQECIRSAANLKYSMNFSVDPCDDFYQFCCGKWSQEHPNHGWYSSFSTFTTLTEKIAIESMEVLGEGVKNGEPVPVSQAKRLYASCLATDSIDVLGLNPLYDYLSLTNLPLVPSFFNKTPQSSQFDWIKTEVLLKLVLAMDVFIGFTVQPNLYRRNENVIYLGVLFQNCPLPSPLKRNQQKIKKHRKIKGVLKPLQDDETEDEREALRRKIRGNIFTYVTKYIMKNTSLELPEDSDFEMAADIINNITSYMDNLQENFTLPEGEYGEEETRRVSFKELQDLTDSNVKKPMPEFWVQYISSLFESTNVTIDPQSDFFFIIETELDYLWTVLDYVSSQSQVHIELYMWWSAVYAMVINTSSDVAAYILRQTSMYYGSGSDAESFYARSRSLDCCELVNKYMGWAVSYAIADKTFANKTKPKVEKMISDIKAAFIDHVRGIRWMDEDTKKVTLEKSNEMLSFIGYPDWLFKNGALDKKYWGLEINETTYLSNMVNIIMQYSMDTLTSLRLANPRDWSTEATTVNAFNSFQDNAINIPMAILNYPLYDLGLEVLNYGSIGAILGHEFTHGFDNAGRKLDKYGNYVQWWSNKTIETFEEMTKCFVNQYENYTLKGISGHVKGKATLGENLADNGGLNQAYTAYQRYIQQSGAEPKLPGFEHYSSDQMFFIAYGSLWCETLSIEDLKIQLEHDEHCPNSVRVIGTLQNSMDFAKAFDCPRNSYMNPEKRKCRIW